MSTLGTDWVDNFLLFMSEAKEVKQALRLYEDFARFNETSGSDIEGEFLDVREALLRVRPERTYLEELDLFSLRRSLATVATYATAFRNESDEESENEAAATSEWDAEGNPTDENEQEKDFTRFRYPELARITDGVACFPEMVHRIDDVLNKYGKIKDTASAELLSIRHQTEQTVRSISYSLRSIVKEAQVAGYIDKDVAPTLRDGRLVIPVSPGAKRKIKGIVHDESATGKTVFIEPAAVVEANNRIRELKAAERREVIRILQELTAMVRPHIPAILDSMHFLAHVDFLRALCAWSSSTSAIVPRVEESPRIDWAQAVHPLLKQTLEKHGNTIVPLDVSLNPQERILLISGPNAGGKSVCLKTVGLLQYMLQCGMPVPVGYNTTAGIFSDIFIDIGDEQSIEDDLSTYSSHLLNMKHMLRHAGASSLLLIDEFGSGTEPQIGGALAEAILNRFVAQNAYGIITTHYQNLKHYADGCPTVANGAMLYDRAQMKPLFVLQVGRPGSSFAIEIARKIGLPEDVIQYAADLVGKDYVMSDKFLQDIVRDKMYWENKRRNIRTREKQLEETLSRYEQDMAELKDERKKVLTEAKEQAQELLKQANAQIENTIRSIKEAQAEKERTREVRAELTDFGESLAKDDEEDERIARKLAKLQRRQQRREREGSGRQRHREGQEQAAAALLRRSGNNSPQPGSTRKGSTVPENILTAGTYVRLKGQQTVGRIESVNGNNAKVLFGMLYTQVPLKRLEWAEAPDPGAQRMQQAATFISKATRDAMYEKKLQFKPEIDIRGMHIDEALKAVSYFIDDAVQFEQQNVRILHGTGTGALRDLVRNYLRTAPGVRSFRDEHVQFGGAGITVVELE